MSSSSDSLELTKIYVHTAVATILFYRGLVNQHTGVFVYRKVAHLIKDGRAAAYNDFLQDTTSENTIVSNGFYTLVRGADGRVDQILDLLENGVYSLLDNNDLLAVQLEICSKPNNPGQILEAYTFRCRMPPIQRNGPPFLLDDALKGFKAGIRSLIKDVKSLPGLPRRRSLGFNVIYDSSHPAEYPAGFDRGEHRLVSFPETPRTTWTCEKTGALATGHHRIETFINHLNHTTFLPADNWMIPAQMKYGTARERLMELDALDDLSLPVYADAHLSADVPNLTPSLPQHSSHTPPQTDDTPRAPAQTDGADDARTKEDLQKMLQPSPVDSNLIPTQTYGSSYAEHPVPAAKRSRPSEDKAAAESSKGKRAKRPRFSASHHERGIMEEFPDTFYRPQNQWSGEAYQTLLKEKTRRFVIAPKKMSELLFHVSKVDENRGQPRFGRQWLQLYDKPAWHGFEIKRLVEAREVKCECKINANNGVVVSCVVCGTLQHAVCYGWQGEYVVQQPPDHVCYSCLVLPQEDGLMAYMSILVAMRNALTFLLDKELSGDEDHRYIVAAFRHRGQPENLLKSDLIKHLEHHGFIDCSDNKIVSVGLTNEKYEAAIQEFVHPLAGISHHYLVLHTSMETMRKNYKEGLRRLTVRWRGQPNHLVRSVDSFGSVVGRFGSYPELHGRQSDLQSSRAQIPVGDGVDIPDAGGLVRPPRRVSESARINFDEPGSDHEHSGDSDETESAIDNDETHEHERDEECEEDEGDPSYEAEDVEGSDDEYRP